MTTAQTRAQEVEDSLLGTCNALPDDVLEDADLCHELDNLVWLCETCGWWVETHETNEAGECEQCQKEAMG